MDINISFVITVFNKEKYLPLMIRSITRHIKDLTCEFVFVDDASTDNSIATIEKIFNNYKHLTTIANHENLGPSIRLNQGCKFASGKYLFLMDADDILAKNALIIMLECIKKENADFVFGLNKVTKKSQQELYKIELPIEGKYHVSHQPLDNILIDKCVRMSYLVTRELYLKSGGADEKIFIQDESLPLRLAYNAKKMINLIEPAIYGSKEGKSLSKNKFQQIHDRFYAYYNALHDFSNLTNNQRLALYKRAFSSIWKAKRNTSGFKEKIYFFFLYLKVKVFTFHANMQILEQYKSFIDNLKDVRKMH